MIEWLLVGLSSEVTTPLPSPPADPLHIMPRALFILLLAGIALLVLALLFLLLRYFALRRPRPVEEPPPPQLAPTPTPATGIGSRIRALEDEFLKTKQFREGCHILARVVKAHLGRSSGHPIERMTSPEIAIMVEDQRVGSFMTDLSRRRYGREEPRRRHFVKACAEARELLA